MFSHNVCLNFSQPFFPTMISNSSNHIFELNHTFELVMVIGNRGITTLKTCQGATPVHRGGRAGGAVSVLTDRRLETAAPRPPQQSVRSPARAGLARLAPGGAQQGIPVQVAEGIAAGRRDHLEAPLETGN